MSDVTPGTFSIRSPPPVSSLGIDWVKDVFNPLRKAHPPVAHPTSSSVHGLLEGSTAEHGRRDPQTTQSRGRSPTPRVRTTQSEFLESTTARAGEARGDSKQGKKSDDAQQTHFGSIEQPNTTSSIPGPITQGENWDKTKEADSIQVQDWPQMHSFHRWKLALRESVSAASIAFWQQDSISGASRANSPR